MNIVLVEEAGARKRISLSDISALDRDEYRLLMVGEGTDVVARRRVMMWSSRTIYSSFLPVSTL